MRKNNSKQIQEEVFIEAETPNTSVVNVADIVKSNNKNEIQGDIESNIEVERELFEE